MKYHDISPTISPKIAVWPGDVPFERKISCAFEQGDHLLLSSIKTTVHLGAHADAPNHYVADGQDIASRSLHYYYGPAQVLHVNVSPGSRIYLKDVNLEMICTPRVLFRTNSYPNPDQWHSNFNSLSTELIDTLAKKGVILIGIDTPSIDPENSKALESHNCIAEHDLAILEGLVLTNIPESTYTLIALPLKIKDADASPVRAVLIEEDPDKEKP